MTPWPRRAAVCLILSLPPAQGLFAQEPGYQALIENSIVGWAYRYSGTAYVNSYARATLYGPNGRLYEEIILGHKIQNSFTYRIRYQNQFSSPNGYANSVPGTLDVEGGCYLSVAVAHANAYNLHPSDVKEACTDYIDPWEPPPPPPKENCPILLDLRQDGFHLSGPNPAVRFDLDADGALDEIAWTEAGGDDAFLCWDRNGNGIIDDGRELFGYATPLLSGRPAKVGYRALAELDEPELAGNGDGKIDAQDSAFRQLCVWVDENRDGVSQPAEIHTPDAVGVVALDYRYKPVRVWDSFGNLFRYESSATMRSPSGSVRSWSTFDVIFADNARDR